MERILKQINWPTAARLAQHPLTRSALLMLSVGYLVLWSDAFSELFRFQEQLSTYGFFKTETRLRLVYFGAISVVFGIVIFEYYCPFVCKHNKDKEEYFSNIIQHHNITQLREAIDRINIDRRFLIKGSDTEELNLKGWMKPFYVNEKMISDKPLSQAFVSHSKLRHSLSTLLFTHFKEVQVARFIRCALSIFLMLIGIFLVLIPSMEVFVLVLAKTIGILEFIPTIPHS